VGPRQHVDALGALGRGRVTRVGRDHDRIGQERRALGDLRELARELAEGQVQRAVAHEGEGGGVPEGRRAAVAERHLVALGQREEVA
jgi:hypothetical protein